MASSPFVNSLIRELVEPGVQSLMASRYFSELREGKLSIRRLQGFAIQHYLHNLALCKGFALCMVKHAHNRVLYNHFSEQYIEEHSHPELAKQFGLALKLTEEEFANAVPNFHCLAHTAAVIRGMLLGSPAENRAGALVNESMVGRYSQEFHTNLRKHYGLSEDACRFFSLHAVVDQEHVKMAMDVIAQFTESAREEELIRQSVRNMVRFKLNKFDGIYEAYS